MSAARIALVVAVLTAWSSAFLTIAADEPRAGSDGVKVEDATRAADESTLKDAGLGSDGPSLVEFFRKRTLSPEAQAKLSDTVQRLGDNAFVVREQATRELIEVGRSAVPFLKEGMKSGDLEVMRRCERALDAIEGSSGLALALAATRLLGVKKPDGAAAVALNYLPFSDDDSVEEELHVSLAAVGVRDGKADPALVDALKDKSPQKRGAAAFVVGRASDAEQRGRVKPLLADADIKVRLRAAQGMIAGKDKDAIPALIELLEKAPVSVAWQAEELLGGIAGEQSPQVSVGGTDEAGRRKAREAWSVWWKDQGPKLDLAKIDLEQRALGLTLILAYDGYTNGQGRVWEFGSDRKPRWSIDTDLQGPIDGQMLGGNRLLLAEYNARRVTERDTKGKVLWEHKVNGNPVACQRLPNGNTLIGTLNQVLEVTPAGKEVYAHTIGSGQVTFAQKLRNGHILHISTNGMLVEMDDRGKEIKTIKVGTNASEWLTFDLLPGGRILIPHQSTNKLVEYDSTGKVVWTGDAPSPYSAFRLPNGNHVACSMNQSKMYEVDRSGKVVWEERLQGRPFRIRRR